MKIYFLIDKNGDQITYEYMDAATARKENKKLKKQNQEWLTSEQLVKRASKWNQENNELLDQLFS